MIKKEKILELLKKRWPLVILAGIFLVNLFPFKQTIVLGDFYQLTNLRQHFTDYFYTWFNNSGQGLYNPLTPTVPFYGLQYLLSLVGIVKGAWTSCWLLIFILGSYFSFLYSLRILNSFGKKPVSTTELRAVSLLYVLNTFMLCMMQYGWGYTHHFLIYIASPIVFASFVRYIIEPTRRHLLLHVVTFVMATVAFSNLAFFVAIVLAQAVIGLVLLLQQRARPWLRQVGHLISILALEGVSILYFALPQIIAQRSDIAGFVKVGLGQLGTDPLPLLKLFSLRTMTGYFPNKNVGETFLAYFVTHYLYFIPWILIGYFIFRFMRKRSVAPFSNSITWAYLGALLLFLVLAVRLGAPFTTLNQFIYSLPGFSFFRSADKVLIIYTVLFITVLSQAVLSIRHTTTRYTLLAIILLLPYPIYTGGIARDSKTLHNKDTWEVDDEGYSLGVTIPDEYMQIKNTVDSDATDTSVISLPYAVENSFNWSTYPSWHMIGQDVLYQVYKRHYISANSFTNPSLTGSFIFDVINSKKESSEQLLEALQQYAGRYVIWHKDVSPGWVSKSEHIHGLLTELVKKNKLRKLDDNRYFELYEVVDHEQVPTITASVKSKYQQLNPTKYRLELSGIKDTVTVTFRQSFNRQWTLYPDRLHAVDQCMVLKQYDRDRVSTCVPLHQYWRLQDIKPLVTHPINADHQLWAEYANSWTISVQQLQQLPDASVEKNDDGTYTVALLLTYRPQSYYYLGIFINIVLIGVLYMVNRKDESIIS